MLAGRIHASIDIQPGNLSRSPAVVSLLINYSLQTAVSNLDQTCEQY